MAKPQKPKSPLQRVPTRKLIAAIKQDLRRIPLPKDESKPKKGKE
jgi:hypothetical protein